MIGSVFFPWPRAKLGQGLALAWADRVPCSASDPRLSPHTTTIAKLASRREPHPIDICVGLPSKYTIKCYPILSYIFIYIQSSTSNFRRRLLYLLPPRRHEQSSPFVLELAGDLIGQCL